MNPLQERVNVRDVLFGPFNREPWSFRHNGCYFLSFVTLFKRTRTSSKAFAIA
jgi:hypothetical protein